MFLFKATIVKNSHILTGIYFIFLKKTSWTKLESLAIPNFQVRQNLAVFHDLDALILG